MRAGSLRTRISILRRTEGAQNANGEPIVTWEQLGTFYSRRIDQGAVEVFRAQQTWAEAQYVYEIRTVPNITFRRTDGIVEGGPPTDETEAPTVDVLGIVDPDQGKGVRLHLVCREYRT